MQTSRSSRARLLAAALVGAAGCASASGGAPAASVDGPADPPAPPVVQIREFPASSTVTIVAWSPDETAYGLRGDVRRDGTLVGRHRIGDHSLFLSITYVNDMGGFGRAAVAPVPPGPVLLHRPARSDPQACNGTSTCAPQSIVTVQMPDDLLRQRRDSMVVTFSGGRERVWNVMLPPEVVDAYLRAVDSVTAAVGTSADR